jgi:hypothetical protein
MNLTIQSNGINLEGILWPSPQESPTHVAVVCHPHPQHGGTMHNKVVFRAGRALQGLGMAVLRFNFRGVGKSTGVYDLGRGEKDDVRAAIDYAQDRYPQAAVVLAGFSFGAWIGLQVGCRDERISHLIGIGTPVNVTDFSFLAGCVKPKLFVHGAEDQFGSAERIHALLQTVPEPKKLALIEGTDHFFHGKLERLSQAITEYFRGNGEIEFALKV